MRSRRDQLQAYQFLRRRIVAALLSGEPESLDSPMRRIVRTTFAGSMIAVLLLAGFGFFGVIHKGGTNSWQKGDALILVKGQTQGYVWFQRKLFPMLNEASGRLFVGSGTQRSVSAASLKGVPRTSERGIPGAPNYLPPAKDLIQNPWTVCARTQGDRPEVTVLAGVAPRAGALDDSSAVVVKSEDQSTVTYLIWKGQRFLLSDPRGLPPVLGITDTTPQLVGGAFLNTLPEGPALTFPFIPLLGNPGPAIGGQPTQIGRVFVVHNPNGDQFYVTLNTGLLPISPLVAELLRAAPAATSNVAFPTDQATVLRANQATAASHASPDALPTLAKYPDRTLRQANSNGRIVLCVSLTADSRSQTTSVSAGPALPEVGDKTVTLNSDEAGRLPVADFAYVPPGRAAVVRDQPQPGIPEGTRYFISELGIKFPIYSDEDLAALGYDKVNIPALPPGFLSLLPTGPTLCRSLAGDVPTTPSAQCKATR